MTDHGKLVIDNTSNINPEEIPQHIRRLIVRRGEVPQWLLERSISTLQLGERAWLPEGAKLPEALVMLDTGPMPLPCRWSGASNLRELHAESLALIHCPQIPSSVRRLVLNNCVLPPDIRWPERIYSERWPDDCEVWTSYTPTPWDIDSLPDGIIWDQDDVEEVVSMSWHATPDVDLIVSIGEPPGIMSPMLRCEQVHGVATDSHSAACTDVYPRSCPARERVYVFRPTHAEVMRLIAKASARAKHELVLPLLAHMLPQCDHVASGAICFVRVDPDAVLEDGRKVWIIENIQGEAIIDRMCQICLEVAGHAKTRYTIEPYLDMGYSKTKIRCAASFILNMWKDWPQWAMAYVEETAAAEGAAGVVMVPAARQRDRWSGLAPSTATKLYVDLPASRGYHRESVRFADGGGPCMVWARGGIAI